MSIQSSIDKVVNTALQAKIAKTATNYVDLETERIKKENIHEAKAQHAYKQYREAEEGRALEGGVDINNPRFQRMMDKFSEESERERVATNANIKANPEKKDELEAAGQKRKRGLGYAQLRLRKKRSFVVSGFQRRIFIRKIPRGRLARRRGGFHVVSRLR